MAIPIRVYMCTAQWFVYWAFSEPIPPVLYHVWLRSLHRNVRVPCVGYVWCVYVHVVTKEASLEGRTTQNILSVPAGCLFTSWIGSSSELLGLCRGEKWIHSVLAGVHEQCEGASNSPT